MKNMLSKIILGVILFASAIRLLSIFPPFMLLIAILIIVTYFIPAVVATKRAHPQKTAILITNIFLGWTFLGWVVALVWSFMEQKTNVNTLPTKMCLHCGNVVDSNTAFCAKCGNNLLNQSKNTTE